MSTMAVVYCEASDSLGSSSSALSKAFIDIGAAAGIGGIGLIAAGRWCLCQWP